MGILNSLSLIFTVAAILINIVMAFFVYQQDPQSATNKIFAWLGIILSLWLVCMFVALNPSFVQLSLLATRLNMFFAAPMCLLFYLQSITLPQSKIPIKRLTLDLLFTATLLIMLVAVSSYTFTSLNITNGVASPVPGPALPLAGGYDCLLVIISIYILIKKYRHAEGTEKSQFRSVILGMSLMFGLVIFTIFVPDLVLHFDSFVPLTPIYALCFLAFTAYAIVKHHLFHGRVFATQALVVGLAIILLAQILTSQGTDQKIITGAVLIIIIFLGLFLINSVKREIEQRERLEILDKQLEAANEQLKTLDTARAEFITIASHQLRTPPATIKWFLSAVLSGDYGPLPAEQKDVLEKANRTNNSQISLIDDMLNVSRIERGKMEFLFEPADMLELANVTFEQLEPMAKEKGLQLMFDRPTEKPPRIMADKEKIRQVMNNLIDNAIKYTKAGAVMISLSSTPEEIRFSVKDTGKGISPDEQKTIFDKFSRGKESMTQSAGLGLGLYVAKVVVGQHKGKIWAESNGEGQGSTFVFTLPINSGLQTTTLVDFTAPAKNQ